VDGAAGAFSGAEEAELLVLRQEVAVPVGNGTTVARRVRWRLRQVSPAKGGGVLQPALAHLGNDAVAYP